MPASPIPSKRIGPRRPLSPFPPAWVAPAATFFSTRKVNGGSSRLATGDLKVGKKLYVGNLTYSVDDADLEQLFSEFGAIESAQVVQDRDTGRSKGFGFVEMSTEAEAQAAIDGLHDHEFNGRRLTVNEARPREDRGGGRGRSGGGSGGRGGYGGGSGRY